MFRSSQTFVEAGARCLAVTAAFRNGASAAHTIFTMTSDERAQLIEDIGRSANIRQGIVEQARLSKDFDIAAAWQECEGLDASIIERVAKARGGD